MSYCRNNGQDSDVYVIGTNTTLQCCGCRLYKQSYETRKYSIMMKHLEYHQKMGDKVPARAFDHLAEEHKEKGDYYFLTKNKLPRNTRRTKNELLEQELYKQMEPYKKKIAKKVLQVFEEIYGRKPYRLELDGLAKTVDISMDLYFAEVLEKI